MAVTVAFWPVLTLAAVAMKVPVPDPAGTVTDAGTVRLVLLLLSATAAPPVLAAALKVTEQVDVPGVLRVAGVHDRPLTTVDGGFRVRVAVTEAPFNVPVTVAFWLVLTLAAVAVKITVLDPAGTVTEAGTVRAVLLLLSVTGVPPLGAAALRVTVQFDVPRDVIERGLHVRELSVNGVPTVTVPPVPLAVSLAAAGVVATTLVSPMLKVPEAIEGVMVTVAATPSVIGFAFRPLAMHS